MSKYKKLIEAAAGLGLGFTAGLMTYRGFIGEVKASETPSFNGRSICTGSTCPVARWDADWDKVGCLGIKEDESITKGRARERNILLINHGAYDLTDKDVKSSSLTETGELQALLVAHRLKQLNLPYHPVMLCANTQRAKETAANVFSVLKLKKGISPQDHLNEGIPAHSIPPLPSWEHDDNVLYVDSQRMEYAFRMIFNRSLTNIGPTFEIIVCHPNLIRFFICRALQFPPEAWLRFSIPHGSLTWLTIHGNGTVSARCIAEHHFIPIEMRSS